MNSATTHLSDAELSSFVDGQSADLERLTAHVRGCPQCLARLQHEARLDEGVRAFEEEALYCPGCDRPCRRSEGRCAYCGVAFCPGGFQVEAVLHQSDHGRLYLASSERGPVALKELVFARVPDVEALQRFEREAKLLKELRHPRIPEYVASFSEGEGVHLRLYLAQRYVDGRSLAEELEARRFTDAEVAAIAHDVLKVLIYLQSLSPPVLHRDVKPANLVRDADGALFLVDFGSARDVAHTVSGTLVGTFGYMPAEQLMGIVDESTDVYALGATLRHLLTRKAPWKGSSDSSEAGSKTPLGRAIERMLLPRDQGRVGSATAALALLEGKDKPARRRSALTAALGVTALCAIAIPAGAAYLAQHRQAAADGESSTAAQPSVAPPRAAAAFLSIDSQPDVQVIVDEVPLSKTPLSRHELTPGRHTLRFEDPVLGIARKEQVVLEPGEHYRKSFVFSSLALERDAGNAASPEKELHPAVAPLKAALVRGAVSACFRAEALDNPAMPRQLKLAYTALPEGRVSDVRLENPELLRRPVQACLEAALAKGTWPTFAEEQHVEVPFTLEPGFPSRVPPRAR